jgi:hypothetical protein
LALLMALFLEWSPLMLGLTMSAVIWSLAFKLRRISQEVSAEAADERR